MPPTPRLFASSAAIALVVVLASLGCGGSLDTPGGPTGQPTAPVALGAEFTLAPGQTSTVDGGRLAVTFVEVSDDSRCPTSSSVRCVWEGDAVVRMTVAVRATEPGGTASVETSVELHANAQFAMTSTVGGYTVALVAVHPEATTDPIESDAYRATFQVDTD